MHIPECFIEIINYTDELVVTINDEIINCGEGKFVKVKKINIQNIKIINDILPEDDIKISGSNSMFVWQISSDGCCFCLEIANSLRQLDKLNNDHKYKNLGMPCLYKIIARSDEIHSKEMMTKEKRLSILEKQIQDEIKERINQDNLINQRFLEMQDQITKQNQQIYKYQIENKELQNVIEKQKILIDEMNERIQKIEEEYKKQLTK